MNSSTKFQVLTDCPLTGPTSYIAPAAAKARVIVLEEDGQDADGDQASSGCSEIRKMTVTSADCHGGE